MEIAIAGSDEGRTELGPITSLIVDPQTHGANPFDRIADTLIIVN